MVLESASIWKYSLSPRQFGLGVCPAFSMHSHARCFFREKCNRRLRCGRVAVNILDFRVSVVETLAVARQQMEIAVADETRATLAGQLSLEDPVIF